MNNHDICILCTDFEPDDILAFIVLKNNIPLDLPLLIICGEGNLDKTGLALNIFKQLGFTDFIIVQGDLSNKDYPPEALLSFGEPLAEVDERIIKRDARTVLKECLTSYNNPFIISIKPMREIMDMPIELTQKCVMAKYGSFNLRCMFDKKKPDDVAEFINNRFKEVLLYESFPATGSQNSINQKNAREIFDKLNPEMIDIIIHWNKHIVKDCQQSIHKIKDKLSKDPQNEKLKERFKKNVQIIQNVEDADYIQLVLADFAMMTVIFHKLGTICRGNISFNSLNYTVHTPDENGKVLFVENVDFNQLIHKISQNI